MAENAAMKIEIPGVDFNQLARETIAIRLTESLIGADDAIRKIVIAAMEQKVNEHGVVPQRSYEETLPYVEWLAGDLIRKAVLDVLKTKIEALRPTLEKAVERELKAGVNKTAKLLVDAVVSSATSQYGFKADIIIRARERS